jgi:hypothetical protein
VPDVPAVTTEVAMSAGCVSHRFAEAVTPERLEQAAAALRCGGFGVEILDDAVAARKRVREQVPEGSRVFTASSETLRLSGIEADLNDSGRYDSIRLAVRTLAAQGRTKEIWQLTVSPDVVVGSVAAATEAGALVVASATGSQLPAYAGGATRAIWVVGAQKVVPDLDTALRRVYEHALPLEDSRARQVYGRPSAVNRLLVLTAEPVPDRATVLLLRRAIGF